MHLFSLLFVMLSILLGGCKKTEKSPHVSVATEVPTPSAPLKTPESADEAPGAPSLPDPFSGIVGGGGGGGGKSVKPTPQYVHFLPNLYDFWVDPDHATTYLFEDCTGDDCVCTPEEESCQGLPAFADILEDPSNFIWCKGGPYALCYYSGPTDGATDLGCELSADGKFANCKCFEIPWGTYFVDINAILNFAVYQETVQVCGADGSACSGSANINKAPVCTNINQNTLIPKADLVSVFSMDCVPTDGIGQTDCGSGLYAGCMTAPCQTTATKGIVECSCPTFNGPFQVGSTLTNPSEQCNLGDGLVWSAAYSPSSSTLPPTSPCIPDAPGGNGCPLYNNTMTVPMGIDCGLVCDAYACQDSAGIEPAFTCDATLCTGECNERALLEEACQGLQTCNGPALAEVIKLESQVGCSCCASQLCGCIPNQKTNEAIFDLNKRQRDLNIVPQCDVNSTLCGCNPHTSLSKKKK